MALIKREDLVEKLCEIPGYFDEERDLLIPIRDVRKLISIMPTVDAPEARLMTPDDFKNNPNVDDQKRLPCWVEYKDDYGGWSFVCEWEIADAEGHRFWTSRPTEAQMEAIPWQK